MKKVKIIITLTMICAAVFSSVFARRLHPASVYYKPAGVSTYTLIQCTLIPRNTFCSYVMSRNSVYYTFNGSSYSVIANGQAFYVPTAQ